MICLPALVDMVKSATGWAVYPEALPQEATHGVVYEVSQETDPAHGESAPGGPVEVILFFFHDELSVALSKAREVENRLVIVSGQVLCSDGRLAGGHVASREIGREPGGLYFAMLRIPFYEEA